MRTRTRAAAIAVISIAVLLTSAHAESALSGPHRWAPAEVATIHPGVQIVTAGQCTSNFVFADATDVYLGQAAHCSGTGAADDTDGCTAGVLPLGRHVTIEGASRPGVVVYNSWVTMHERGETDAATCAFNDFALVKVHPDDHSKVNPSVPFWGGPNELGNAGGLFVYSYQNSSLRMGLSALSPKRGINTGTGDAWSHNVYTLTPGIPGDSGSGFLGEDGSAIGVLSTLEVFPRIGSNNVIDLARALEYMHRYTDLDDVHLVPGTTRFSARLI